MGVQESRYHDNSLVITYNVPHLLYTDHFLIELDDMKKQDLTNAAVEKIALEVLQNQIEGSKKVGDINVTLNSDRNWLRIQLDRFVLNFLKLINISTDYYDFEKVFSDDRKEKIQEFVKVIEIQEESVFVDDELKKITTDLITEIKDYALREYVHEDDFNGLEEKLTKIETLISERTSYQNDYIGYKGALLSKEEMKTKILIEQERRTRYIKEQQEICYSTNYTCHSQDEEDLSILTSKDTFDKVIKSKYFYYLKPQVQETIKLALKNGLLTYQKAEGFLQKDDYSRQDLLYFHQLHLDYITKSKEKLDAQLIKFTEYRKVLTYFLNRHDLIKVRFPYGTVLIQDLLTQGGNIDNNGLEKYFSEVEQKINEFFSDFRRLLRTELDLALKRYSNKINIDLPLGTLDPALKPLSKSIDQLQHIADFSEFITHASNLVDETNPVTLLTPFYSKMLFEEIDRRKFDPKMKIEITDAFSRITDERDLDNLYHEFKVRLR